MNIFVVDKHPQTAARQLCDKHVVKMVLESAQMLCSVFENGKAPYKRAYYNHPCTKWSRESEANYEWLITHAWELCEEYFQRYGKLHKCIEVIEWCDDNYHKLNLPKTGLTKFAQAMPEEYRNPDAVVAYRNYYNGEKAYFASWARSCWMAPPDWFEKKCLALNSEIKT